MSQTTVCRYMNSDKNLKYTEHHQMLDKYKRQTYNNHYIACNLYEIIYQQVFTLLFHALS